MFDLLMEGFDQVPPVEFPSGCIGLISALVSSPQGRVSSARLQGAMALVISTSLPPAPLTGML